MAMSKFRELKYYLASDYIRLGGGGIMNFCKILCLNEGFKYVFWLRICHFICKDHLLLPLFVVASLRLRRLQHKYGIQIPYTTTIGPGFYIGHFGTIVISEYAIIGKNVNISQGVTIGQANRDLRKGVAQIGDEVYIGPGAKIVGAVRIGNNVAIGANAVVTKDVPDNAVVAGIPAKIISMQGSVGYVNCKV